MAAKSIIWDYFTINPDDESKVSCNACGKAVSRGKKKKNSWGHSGLKNHLATHPAKISEFETKKKEKAAANTASIESTKSDKNQTTLEQSFVKVWDIK